MNSTRLKINTKKIVWRKSGNAVVILSMVNGQYLSLNTSASYLWELICSGVDTVEALVENMIKDYDVSKEKARKDIQSLIKELGEEEFILSSVKAGKSR